jgi:hypothetical protein
MRAILLGADELAALAGLPAPAVVLYVLGLRPRMDLASGTVGRAGALVSWQALRESVYQEPRRGVLAERFSIDQVRRLGGVLERAGLVRRLNKGRGDLAEPLFFALPLALVQSVEKKAAKEPAKKAAKGRPTDFPRETAERSTESRQDSRRESRQPSEIPRTVTPNPPRRPPPEGEGKAAAVEWSRDIPEPHRPAIGRQVERLNGHAQSVVDELAGLMRAGASNGRPVKMPARYVARLVAKVEAGEFVPELGPAIAAERAQARAVADRLAELEQPGAAADPAAAAAARAAVAELAARSRRRSNAGAVEGVGQRGGTGGG